MDRVREQDTGEGSRSQKNQEQQRILANPTFDLLARIGARTGIVVWVKTRGNRLGTITPGISSGAR